MNIMPLMSFWSKHGQQIADLAAKNKDNHHIIMDFAWSIAPFLQRHFPQVNDQGILDDALAALQATFDDSPPVT